MLARPLVTRLLARSVRRYQTDAHFKPPTMDELPVPQGRWEDLAAARNKKYNLTMAFGIGFAVFTIIVAKTSGLVYLNYSPPKSLD